MLVANKMGFTLGFKVSISLSLSIFLSHDFGVVAFFSSKNPNLLLLSPFPCTFSFLLTFFFMSVNYCFFFFAKSLWINVKRFVEFFQVHFSGGVLWIPKGEDYLSDRLIPLMDHTELLMLF